MGISKVVFGDNTLIDLTNDTVTADKLAEGITAHGADGEQIVGEMLGPLGIKEILSNGIYYASSDNLDGYSAVMVDVPQSGDYKVFVEKTEPTSSQGNIGDFYILYADNSEFEPLVDTKRSYSLTITGGLRGYSTLDWIGAQEVQLFYDDGEGNEVNIRTLPNFTYAGQQVYSNLDYAFDGNTAGSYWESHPLPEIITFSAIVPSGYTLKRFVVWQRQNSYYNTDVWSDFELTETVNDKTRTLLSESGLTIDDWAGAGYGTEWGLESGEDVLRIINTYVKIGETEQTAQWYKSPITTGGKFIAKTITSNGRYTAKGEDADGYYTVDVNVRGGFNSITSAIGRNSGKAIVSESFSATDITSARGSNGDKASSVGTYGVTGTTSAIGELVPKPYIKFNYTDSSPVTYTTTLDADIAELILTNIWETQSGCWFLPTKDNVKVEIMTASGGSYVQVDSNDFDLQVTGSSGGEYRYTLTYEPNEYIHSVRFTFTRVYRVGGWLYITEVE